ncbi:hypothetical protein PISMIDRAFT_687387 [Pisolithus microcarpus 441]|uniref:Uncharacterized protein n=1 Tax=Pisolithus microcarpus 441 TaxID=765257 RepID=A0A0C9XSI4_9AGAM|nr:hypothetical protein PISMIDRAFT_687387 [Pisolithus microcarpus 441]
MNSGIYVTTTARVRLQHLLAGGHECPDRPFHFIDAMYVSIEYDLSKMSERVQHAKPPGR